MADEDLSLEDPKEEAESEEGEDAGGKKKLIIIIAAAVVVLIIGGGAAAYFLLGDDSEAGSDPVADSEITEVSDGEEASDEIKPVKSVPAPEKGDVIYIGVAEPFLVNIKSGKRTRMMQIKIQFMVRSKDAEDAVKLHMPLVRNNLLDFFSTADANEVGTREGRSALKDGALKTARKVIKEQVGFDAIEMILFTGFVIQ
ncbi:MAG: flagellar basal body-associated protein FliL [Gammaproteobacteria bacterium]|nr:flagellar basal body-associated protein FliL [Gammaproteobacteria bacterium]